MFAFHGLLANRTTTLLLSILVIILTTLLPSQSALATTLGLEQSIHTAISQDIWHQQNTANIDVSRAQGIIDSAMPNPKLGLGLANVASDSLRFNQEPMTQFKLSVSQQFLRGDSANLSLKMQQQRRQMFPVMAQERRAQVSLAVAKLWLNAYANNTRKTMVEQEKLLLQQLISTAQRRYEVGHKGTSQSDIIVAQVELAVMEDRINQLQLSANVAQQKLRQWLPSELVDLPLASDFQSVDLALKHLPKSDQQWSERLYKHPTLFTFIKMHQALSTGVEMAAQQRKMQWGVNASYGLRGDDLNGSSRSDLLSVGVSIDVPLFNDDSNDSKMLIAKKKLTMHQTQRLLQLQSMIAQARSEQETLHQLNKRLALYDDKLLPQTASFVQAASAAYRNNKGEFSSIMRASLAKLNREVEAFDITMKQQLSVLTLNYLLTQTTEQSSGAHHE
jgi:outer membrane protein TolC